MRSELDRRTRRWDGGRTLLSPTGRLLRLTPKGARAVDRIAAGEEDPRLAGLRTRLHQAGAAHPLPDPATARDVTVVIPVHDRADRLEVLLAALHGRDVLVVDDGSTEDLAPVCERHGARFVRRPNGGPAAARNTAIPLLDEDFVAFLDSDCLPPGDWLEQLRGHFADPGVVAVAPRVVGGPRSPLDLGPRAAAVRPGTAVPYVPTAALLVRRAALQRFDEGLRYGEDVDLVWRLVEAGGAVRYDPRVVVEHAEPRGLAALARRFRYGTSAAPLSLRHPDSMTHLVLPPLPALTAALALRPRPRTALAAGALATLRLHRDLDHLPTSGRVVATATWQTALGAGRALQLLGPAGWWLALRSPRAAALLLAPVVVEHRERDSPEPLPRFAARVLLDQAAYGAGVLAGCVRHRTARPLLPRAQVGRSPGRTNPLS